MKKQRVAIHLASVIEKVKVSQSCPTLCNQPHRLYSPWNSPGQNTRVGSLSLLQGIFPTQGSNWGLLHCRQILYQLSYQGSPILSELRVMLASWMIGTSSVFWKSLHKFGINLFIDVWINTCVKLAWSFYVWEVFDKSNLLNRYKATLSFLFLLLSIVVSYFKGRINHFI